VLIDILNDEFRSHQEKLYIALGANETLPAPSVLFTELMPQLKGDTGWVVSFLKDH
jgi:hypothetical protein